MFGLPADHDAIIAVADAHGLFILDDAAQAFGATYKDRKLGAAYPGRKPGMSATATSFFPAKPLGCYGDGGAIFVDDDALAARLKSLRVHGEGVDKYDATGIGLAARLDSIQAAVLLEKLKIFPDEIVARNTVAQRYAAGLAGVAIVPRVGNEATSVWAQYTIRLAPGRRDALAAALKDQGIPTAIYYAKPLHRQAAYRGFPVADGGLAGQRAFGRGSHQPADARLSRCADPGSNHRRGAPGAGRVVVIRGPRAACEPGIHHHRLWIWIPDRRCAAIRNDARSDNS